MIIFATCENVQLLRDSREWFLDGTFAVCPLIFRQLYTIHVMLPEGKTVPVVYALLASKNGVTYRKLLNRIVDALGGSYPQLLIHTDFEFSMIKEIEAIFPTARILGCAFHFNQCVWRHIQSDSALLRKCRENVDFFLEVRMFTALAFVPAQETRSMFELLLSSQFVQDNYYILTPFINYFENTWVGRARNPPLMKIEWWNVYQSTLNGTARTNNAAEAWHSAFSGRLGVSHPSFFKLVGDIQQEQGNTEYLETNSSAQGNAAAPRAVYRDLQRRLFELVSDYPNNGGLRFLRNIAHNIKFK